MKRRRSKKCAKSYYQKEAIDGRSVSDDRACHPGALCRRKIHRRYGRNLHDLYFDCRVQIMRIKELERVGFRTQNTNTLQIVFVLNISCVRPNIDFTDTLLLNSKIQLLLREVVFQTRTWEGGERKH
jgi:hypothetical protein